MMGLLLPAAVLSRGQEFNGGAFAAPSQDLGRAIEFSAVPLVGTFIFY